LHRPIGIIGKFFNDWNYAPIYDFGGSSDGFGGAAPGSLAGLAVWLLFAFFWQMLVPIVTMAVAPPDPYDPSAIATIGIRKPRDPTKDGSGLWADVKISASGR
jgi:hypothetical protein